MGFLNTINSPQFRLSTRQKVLWLLASFICTLCVVGLVFLYVHFRFFHIQPDIFANYRWEVHHISTQVALIWGTSFSLTLNYAWLKLLVMRNSLQDLANLDGLTGLLNRDAFYSKIHAIGVGAGLHRAFLLLDLDHFKRINDRYGHPVGDEVLVNVAQLINANIGPQDFAGRLGGEEFVISASGSTLEMQELAETLRQKLETAQLSQTVCELRVTVSIGVVHFSGSAFFDQLYKSADSLLYKAKRDGRNRIEAASAVVTARGDTE